MASIYHRTFVRNLEHGGIAILLHGHGMALVLATILDLMGLNDAKLNYLHARRIQRLTDIGGNVISESIA